MKGKKILTLVSAMMGLAIVGTTFAAWAVTDNADPFGMKISPSDIHSEDTKTVTLSWGGRTFGNVENLGIGAPRLAASFQVKAETSNESAYKGKLVTTLINQTTKSGEAPDYLIDHLLVRVYKDEIQVDGSGNITTNLSTLTPIATVPIKDTTPLYTVTTEITVTHNVAYPLWAVVALTDDVTPAFLEKIKTDIVYLQFDWNSNGTDEVTTTSVYYNYKATGKDVYLYSWKDGGKTTNAAWPGVKMTEVENSNGIYEAKLDLTYQDFLFVDYTGDTEVHKTLDINVSGVDLFLNPCYTENADPTQPGTWGKVPQIEVLTKDYYLVGDKKNDWMPTEEFGLTKDPDDSDHYSIAGVQLAANEKIKICDKNRSDAGWLTNASTWEGCGFTLDADGNIIVTDAGAYNIDVHVVNCLDNNHVTLTKATA